MPGMSTDRATRIFGLGWSMREIQVTLLIVPYLQDSCSRTEDYINWWVSTVVCICSSRSLLLWPLPPVTISIHYLAIWGNLENPADRLTLQGGGERIQHGATILPSELTIVLERFA
jgi:hypothetical protein